LLVGDDLFTLTDLNGPPTAVRLAHLSLEGEGRNRISRFAATACPR
jgi:hypothetical protein